MPNVKEYNNRLKSLKNTKKITKTMKLVSASKLRKAYEAQANAKLYAENLKKLMARISVVSATAVDHVLLQKRINIKSAHVVVYTSDKGLCGAFNNNCYKHVLQWSRATRYRYQTVEMSFCGKRGYQFFHKKMQVHNFYSHITSKPDYVEAEKVGNDLIKGFLNGQHDEVYLVYNQFFNPLSQKTIFEKILPIEYDALMGEKLSVKRDYLFEPQPAALLDFLIPHYVYFKVYFALLENAAGEHGARMSAMDNATKNASDLIDRYTLLRNRVRQAQITTELTEIVSGVEALK